MSEWMRLLSEMKRRPMEDYLTPRQRDVRNTICTLLEFPNRINLFGPYGSGKTYVAWSLVRATGATHVPVPERLHQLQPVHEILVIDNVSHYEDEIRRLLATSNLLGAQSVIFITHEPTTLPMHRIELPLPNKAEIEIVLQSYRRLGYYQQHDLPPKPNFWNVLSACV
jgi:hypothetical protein